MCTYTHTKKRGGGKTEKYGSWLPKQAKQLKTFDHAWLAYHGKQARKVIWFKAVLLCTVKYIYIYKMSENTFSRTFGKKSTLFP